MMANIEQKLKKLFDFQKFEKNNRLESLAEETEMEGRLLTEEELSLVTAAGEIGAENPVNWESFDR